MFGWLVKLSMLKERSIGGMFDNEGCWRLFLDYLLYIHRGDMNYQI